MADQQSELLLFPLNDLNRMKQEFIECYDKVIYDAENGLQKALLIKLNSMKECQEQLDNFRFERDFKSNYETLYY